MSNPPITTPPATENISTMTFSGCDISFDALAGHASLQRQLEATVTSRASSVPVDLVWRNLVFDVPLSKKDSHQSVPEPVSSNQTRTPLKPGMKRILHHVSGQVRCGQVLAIMGASGSGKTTMLNMLSGRLKSSNKCTTAGKVYVNGQSRNFDTFRHIAKFVEQDDTSMFAELTVREQILYAARLALSGEVTEAQKIARVDRIIQELGLSKAANTYIGSEIVRGVSGGERRRAAIGVELVTDPSLIFLDEPTTGLDSFNALNVMTSLRHLAKNDRTIITTIHQPRSSIFHMFDLLCLIAEGHIVYFGPASEAAAHFANLGFRSPPHFNVADFVIDVLSIDHRSEEKEVSTTARIQFIAEYYRERIEPSFLADADAYEAVHKVQPQGNQMQYSNNLLQEFSILTKRTVVLMARERQINIMRLGQNLFFAIVLGVLWLDSGRSDGREDRRAIAGVLFFLLVNQTFESAFGIVFSFPAERNVINRERASGFYRDISYFVGKQLLEVPRAVVFNFLLLIIVYFMAGLQNDAGSFFTLLFIISLTALAGEGLSQTISVFAGNEQVASALVPVAVIFQLLFGGYFITPDAMPSYIAWARYLSFMYYAFIGAVRNEMVLTGEDPFDKEIVDELSSSLSQWTATGILISFVVFLKVAYFFALTANKPRFDRKL